MSRDSESSSTPGANTRAVHGAGHPPGGAVGTPIVHSATFTAPSLEAMLREQDLGADGNFYQRVGHPTLRHVEARLAALEGAPRALLFGSGMAAISSVLLAHLRPGDHVVALRQCYGGTIELLHWGAERFGWSVAFVDARDPASWDAAFTSNTRILHVESPTNPTLCIVDLEQAAGLAHRRGALLSVDNTFASPMGQQPFARGADLVTYSATKSIGGHSDLLAGVALGSREALDPVFHARVVFGGTCDPTTAWLIERSVKTLPMRVAAANANALGLATRLAGHPDVTRVHYPGLVSHPGHEIARRQMALGFGPVIAIELRDAGHARSVLDGVTLFGLGPSLGGVDSLIGLPAATSHRMLTPAERSAAGISDGMLRLSVGIEDLEDLWADLDRALSGRPGTTR